MLRLRRLAVGCALGSAGATLALVLVASLNFAYRAPALHVALETTAAIVLATPFSFAANKLWAFAAEPSAGELQPVVVRARRRES